MNVCAFFKSILVDLFVKNNPDVCCESIHKLSVEPPKESIHGDLSTNAAMVLCKLLKKSPQAIAQELVLFLKEVDEVLDVSVAGPGFVNFTLKPSFVYAQLQAILFQKHDYGRTLEGQGKKVNVEFVSANPTGPLHAGHARNAVLGDVIASLLEGVGYDVCREYYINDAGGQIKALAHSLYLRYREQSGEKISPEQFTKDMYGADYLVPVARSVFEQYGEHFLQKDVSIWLPLFENLALEAMMRSIYDDLDLLGIHMTHFTSERQIIKNRSVEHVLDLLNQMGDIYQGILEAPKGCAIDDFELVPQTLFRATKYGDDVDRPLQKSDGSWTYFASDIAYHFDKIKRGFSLLIDVLGADHIGYIKRIKASVWALSDQKVSLEVKTCQLVNFVEKGVPVRMSKRAGTFVTLRDVVEKVGKDATRFIMVSRHQDVVIDFDFAQVVDQTRDNPVFYIQYAHARICSVMRQATSLFDDITQDTLFLNAEYHLLSDASEMALIKSLIDWPRQLSTAALMREPHRIANYMLDLASKFHSLWNKGRDDVEFRFIHKNDRALTCARLALIQGVKVVLSNGLSILGMTPVEEM